MIKRVILFTAIFFFGTLFLFSSSLNKITTNYFSIIFEQKNLTSANEIASFADTELENLAKSLNYSPKEKIIVLLAGNSIVANGFYSPLQPKIVLYTVDSSSRLTGQRTTNYLRALFRHELTHYLHLSQPIGIVKYTRPIFGAASSILNTFLMPMWWIEGVATYYEQGRLFSREFDLIYHEAIVNQRAPILSKASYPSTVKPYNRPYATGLAVINYLIENYGESTFNAINHSFVKNPILGIDSAFKKHIGLSANNIYQLAQEEIRKRYLDYEISHDQDTLNIKGDLYLPYKTDENIIALGYSSSFDGFIYDFQQDKIVARNIPFSDEKSARVSNDGKSIYFSFAYSDLLAFENTTFDKVGYSDIYSYDIESKKYSRLTNSEKLKHPSLSRDKTKLVAIEVYNSTYQIVLLDLKRESKTLLYRLERGSLYEPLFSYDEKSILAIEVVDGKSSLIEIKDSKVKTLIGPSKATISSVRYINEDIIYFSSDLNGKLALYSYNFKNSQTKEILTDSIGVLGSIKDNDKLYYQTYSNNNFIIKTANYNQLEEKEVFFIDEELENLTSLEKSHDYPISPFIDYPRFNFWLPLSLNQSLLESVGASAYFQSLYERHTIILSSAYLFKAKVGNFSTLYNYNRGRFTFNFGYDALIGQKNNYNQMFNLALDTHLFNKTTPKGSNNFYLTTSAILNSQRKSNITIFISSLTYFYYSLSAADSYWGNYRFQVSGNLVWRRYYESQDSFLTPSLFVLTQVPLGNTNQVLSLETLAMYFGKNYLDRNIKFDLLEVQDVEDTVAKAKALMTLKYRIPFKGVDWSIYYGGITALRSTFYLQNIVNLVDSSILWDKNLVGGVTIEADVALAASLKLTPYATFAINFFGGDYAFRIGLDLGNMLFKDHRVRDIPKWTWTLLSRYVCLA